MAITPTPLPIASYQLPDLRAGAKRLVNTDFTIESAPGQGTTVTIAMWATPGLTPIQARLPVRS